MTLFNALKIKEFVSVKQMSSFRMGGQVRFFAVPSSEDELIAALDFARSSNLPCKVVGSGTNIFFADGLIDILLLRLGKGFIFVEHIPEGILVGAAVSVERLVRLFPNQLCIFMGLPGTVGGAIKGNSGVRLADDFIGFAQICKKVKVFDGQEIKWMNMRDVKIGYKYCKVDGIILSAIIDFEQIRNLWGVLPNRPAVEPYPTVGCVFRNPSVDLSAGELIDEMGFKGTRVGGVMVSNIHANFFLNVGGARFSDVEELIFQIKDRAKRELQIDLELEVQIIK